MVMRLLGISSGDVESQKSQPTEQVRWMLTVLTLLRAEALPISIDVSAIVDPFKGNPLELEAIGKYAVEFWDLLRGKLGRSFSPPSQVRWKRFHHTTKRGPSGGHALFGALRDVLSIPDSLVESLRFVGGERFGAILDFLRWNNGMIRELQSKIELLDPALKPSQSGGPKAGVDWWKTTYRRLSGIPDKEGKTRVVAILDYMSQSVLYPVHTFLFGILKVIPSDVTFNQSAFVEKVRSWGPVEYHSVDLSKATDRFPIEIIKAVLSPIFGPEWVSHWANILVGYEFKCPKAGSLWGE